jgi:hypothetical protein
LPAAEAWRRELHRQELKALLLSSKTFFATSINMSRLDTSPNVLQKGVWIGPAQVVLEDKTQVESELRVRPTTNWRKDWTEAGYDFPNTYVTLPQRVMEWNPISTFVDDQNTRFAQRYFGK